jgi:hypothetical protein
MHDKNEHIICSPYSLLNAVDNENDAIGMNMPLTKVAKSEPARYQKVNDESREINHWECWYEEKPETIE